MTRPVIVGVNDARSVGLRGKNDVNVLIEVEEAWNDVRNDGNSNIDWVLASYAEGSKTDITVLTTGNGGIGQCLAGLPSNKPIFGGFKHSKGRFLSFFHTGDGVSVLKRGKASMHKNGVFKAYIGCDGEVQVEPGMAEGDIVLPNAKAGGPTEKSPKRITTFSKNFTLPNSFFPKSMDTTAMKPEKPAVTGSTSDSTGPPQPIEISSPIIDADAFESKGYGTETTPKELEPKVEVGAKTQVELVVTSVPENFPTLESEPGRDMNSGSLEDERKAVAEMASEANLQLTVSEITSLDPAVEEAASEVVDGDDGEQPLQSPTVDSKVPGEEHTA